MTLGSRRLTRKTVSPTARDKIGARVVFMQRLLGDYVIPSAVVLDSRGQPDSRSPVNRPPVCVKGRLSAITNSEWTASLVHFSMTSKKIDSLIRSVFLLLDLGSICYRTYIWWYDCDICQRWEHFYKKKKKCAPHEQNIKQYHMKAWYICSIIHTQSTYFGQTSVNQCPTVIIVLEGTLLSTDSWHLSPTF